MFNTSATPMQYLAAYALVFVAGALAANLGRWHGQYMRAVGRRDTNVSVTR